MKPHVSRSAGGRGESCGKEDIVAQVTYLNIISKTLLIEQIKYTLSILLQNSSHFGVFARCECTAVPREYIQQETGTDGQTDRCFQIAYARARTHTHTGM